MSLSGYLKRKSKVVRCLVDALYLRLFELIRAFVTRECTESNYEINKIKIRFM